MCCRVFSKKANQILSCITPILKWLLLTVSILSLLVSLCFIAQAISLDIDLCLASDCKAHFNEALCVLELFVISATAFTALQVYSTSCKTEEVNVSIKLRELLNSPTCEKVYRIIDEQSSSCSSEASDKSNDATSQNEGKYDAYELDTYLGTLEELYLLYQHNVISKEQIKRQFGYRLKSIVGNKEVMKKLTNSAESKYWGDLVKFIREFTPCE